jgi:hypothetical protein
VVAHNGYPSAGAADHRCPAPHGTARHGTAWHTQGVPRPLADLINACAAVGGQPGTADLGWQVLPSLASRLTDVDGIAVAAATATAGASAAVTLDDASRWLACGALLAALTLSSAARVQRATRRVGMMSDLRDRINSIQVACACVVRAVGHLLGRGGRSKLPI